MSSGHSKPSKVYHSVYDFISPTRLAGSLKDKVALITGASRGIGKAMALAFAEAGADVALLARTQLQLELVADMIRNRFERRVLTFVADATDEKAVRDAVRATEWELGQLDIVVANAGVAVQRPFIFTPMDEWWRAMEVNVKGQLIVAQEALKSMRARGKGVIIFNASSAGVTDFAGVTSYAASKAAVIRAVGCIQTEIEAERKDIQLFAIHPGSVKTDLATAKDAIHPDMDVLKPGYAEIWSGVLESPLFATTPELSAWTSVLLATGVARELRGRYIDATHDLEDLLKRVDVVKSKRLNQLKVEF